MTALKPATPASKAAAAAAKKAVTDKDKPAAADSTKPSDSSGHSSDKAAASTTGHSPANSPRTACEDRMLLGFQSCMADQCAKPAFTQHPICIERRAMDERRREAERNR
jgi:eukaryotic-like serine/threonine-protein kinase